MSGPERPDPRIEVWQESRSSWGWRYVLGEEKGEDLELPASTPEPSFEAAVDAAHLAYPGVPIRELEPPRPVPSRASRPLASTALAGAVTLALVAVAVRARRWWLVLLAPVVATGIAARLRRYLP